MSGKNRLVCPDHTRSGAPGIRNAHNKFGAVKKHQTYVKFHIYIRRFYSRKHAHACASMYGPYYAVYGVHTHEHDPHTSERMKLHRHNTRKGGNCKSFRSDSNDADDEGGSNGGHKGLFHIIPALIHCILYYLRTMCAHTKTHCNHM